MAEWKYIMFEHPGDDDGLGPTKVPIIFPGTLIHESVANTVRRSLPDFGKGYKVVSAGFVAPAFLDTYGESESLGGIKSVEDDVKTMNAYPYESGRNVAPAMTDMVHRMALLKFAQLIVANENDPDGGEDEVDPDG